MRRLLHALLGLAISGLALWLTLRGKDLGAIWEAVRSANYVWLVPHFLALTLIHLAQTWRWGILLEPMARIPFWRLNAVSAVGIMALVVLPFRLGELARPYLIAERPHLPFSAALSSIVVERVTDGLFMAALLVITLLGVPEGTPGLQFLRIGGGLVFLVFAAALAFLILARRHRALALRLMHRALDPLSSSLADQLTSMMDAFFGGLRLVPSRGKVALFFALTTAYWGLSALSIALLARGFDIHLSVRESLTVLGVLVVGIMIPAGPGMVGTYQAAVTLGLALFLPRSVVDARGVAFANVLWAGQIVQVTVFGVVFLFSRHVRVGMWLEAGEMARGDGGQDENDSSASRRER